MRRKVLSILTIALTLFAVSCTNEDLDSVKQGNEVTVGFNAQLPDGLQTKTRAYGDGTTATRLHYAAYLLDGVNWVLTNIQSVTPETINLSKSVTMSLVNGSTYKIVFWAAADNSIYTFDKANAKVIADYSNVNSNDESLDAFYAVQEITVSGATSIDVALKRPFAQLNIGTNDLLDAQSAGREVTQAGITVKTYNTLNFKTQDVEGPKVDVVFDLAALPTGETFPVAGYSYLTMNYLLMPSDKNSDNNVTISYDNSVDRTFLNIPLQRNYRTNIYGSLLTSDGEFNVEIEPDFDGDHDYAVWDGESVETPDADGNIYIITNAAEWNWLKSQNLTGKSIELGADIDFGGHEVTSLSLGGSFDGKGYTLSNLTIVPAGSGYSNGLFRGETMNTSVTIKDVTIKDVTIDSPSASGGYAGVVLGDIQNGITVTLEEVHVINANIKGVRSVAGLVGFVASGTTLNVIDSSVDESSISNYPVHDESGFVAGLVGRPVGTVNFTNSSVSNTNIDAYYSTIPSRGEASVQAILGNTLAPAGASSTNVTVTKKGFDAVASTSADFSNAITGGKSIIYLKPATYQLGGINFGTAAAEITIIGLDQDNSIVNLGSSIYATGKKINLDNITFTVPTGLPYTESGFSFVHHASEFNVSNSNINGSLRLNVSSAVIDNSAFSVSTFSGFDGYGLFYYGNNGSTVTVSNSTFVTQGKAIVMYNEGAMVYNLTVANTTFTSLNGATDKAAIQMHTEYGISGTVTITNSTATGFAAINDGFWNELNNNTSTPTNLFDITIDGSPVH